MWLLTSEGARLQTTIHDVMMLLSASLNTLQLHGITL